MAATAAAASAFFATPAGVAVAGGLASATANKLLSSDPKAPEIKPPTPMPDPLEQQKAREKSIIEQMARRGRGASILTAPASGGTTLGGG